MPLADVVSTAELPIGRCTFFVLLPDLPSPGSSDVDRILAEAHEYDEGPCVVVAEVVKEDNVFPMVPSGAPPSSMIIEKPKGPLAKPTGST